MKIKYLLTIRAEDRPGLLHLVTGVLNRRLTPIISLTAAPTDVHGIVLINVETELTEIDATILALKLEHIVEVLAVDAKVYHEEICLRVAWFKLDRAILNTSNASAITNCNAAVMHWYPNSFLLAKFGTDKSIRKLYNLLDGPHLLGFSQTGLINDSKLIDHGIDDRIIRLAA